MFWTSFIQLNMNEDNSNINSWFSSPYRTVIGLFLAFTNNCITDFFYNKSRTLVLKVNYWLNLKKTTWSEALKMQAQPG